jgi:thiol:disulfide interchange protein
VRWLVLALLLTAHPASAHHSALHFGGSGPQLLEPEKAFRFSTQVQEGAVEVRFAIADGYYL